MAKRNMPTNVTTFVEESVLNFEPEEKFEDEDVVHDPELDEEKVDVYSVTTQHVKLRLNPDKNSRVLRMLRPGTRLITNISSDEWAHVEVYDNPSLKGFVMRKYTEEVSA